MLPATTKKQEIVNILVVFDLLVTYNLQPFIINVLDSTGVSSGGIGTVRHCHKFPRKTKCSLSQPEICEKVMFYAILGFGSIGMSTGDLH